MGFSEFEFRLIGSFRYIGGGVFGLESIGEAGEEHSVLDRWSSTQANLGAPLELIKFRQ